mgnify:FL=1
MVDSQEYNSILVGTDGSEQAKLAFEKAIAVAKRNNARVVVAHIMENRLYGGTMAFSTFTPDILQAQTEQAKVLLDEYQLLAKELGYDHIETVLEFGSPKVLMAKELPERFNTDLIMVGQSGLNAVERLVMGSVSDHIIRTAPCDVLIVRPE